MPEDISLASPPMTGPTLAPEELRRFVAHSEEMVTPKAVAALFGRAEMLARLPLSVQRWIVAHAKGADHMGFIVEPYCVFLAYEIADEVAASRLLPPGYRLIPASMFADGTPRYCAILGAFNVRASFMWGVRVELYLIAEDTRTGMLTWVICDYESNTINYDPGQGFSGPTTTRAIVTTSHAGEILVDVQAQERENSLRIAASLRSGETRALDERLWIDGNLSVDYGGRLAHDGSEPFGLIFDPGEMTQALDLPLDDVDAELTAFGAEFLAASPFEAASFPYAQHFVTTSYPKASPIRDRRSLADAARTRADAPA